MIIRLNLCSLASLMEDVPFAPRYTLAEFYGVTRNIIWKGSPDGKILAS
jgi:hypothetical protein